MTAAKPEHVWQRPVSPVSWPWVELSVTLLALVGLAVTLALVAAGRHSSEAALLPELGLLAALLVAWVLRAAGRVVASSVLMASALLVVGVVLAASYVEGVGVVLAPVIAFVIVVPRLRGWPVLIFAVIAVVAAGLITALDEMKLQPDTALQVPLLTFITAGISALMIASVWVIHRQAQALGSAYADLVVRLPVGVVRLSADGGSLASNPAFDALFPDAARQDVLAALVAAAAGADGADGTAAGTFELDNGGRRRVIAHRTRRFDGGPTGVVIDSAVLDVTAQREAAERGTLLAALGEATDDPLMITSPDGTILWSNAAAAGLFNLSQASLVGQDLQGLPTITEANRQVFRQAVAGQRSFEPVTIALQGVERSFSISASVIRDAEGQPTAVSFWGRDVTEARRLARRQGEEQAQLLDALKIEALTRVIASAADDVSRLAANVERLETDPADPGAVLDAVRAAQAARSLSAYSRSAADHGWAVLDDVVSRAERMLRQLVPRRILLEVQLDAPLPVTLSATEVEEILATLVVNAVDAIEGSGHIWIRTFSIRQGRGEPPIAVVEVGDTGAGMTPDVLARAFEPYFTTKTPGVGAGLGLSSVLRLVEDGGGSIDVQTEVGRGSVVQVRLAVQPGDERQLSSAGGRA